MSNFEHSYAIIIGIDDYNNGISSLKTAVSDATEIARILETEHGYTVTLLLNEAATLSELRRVLEIELLKKIQKGDRFLFYFAGHGIALNGEDGPEGYLIPQNAKSGNVSTYLPMSEVNKALLQLPCRHFLGILDCCFAGAFRWSSLRKAIPVELGTIHKERYDRFIQDPAWQVLTSAAYDQSAWDSFNLKDDRGQIGSHSPFAYALIEALEGKADAFPPAAPGKPAGDGVITASELYLYLRDRIEIATEARAIRQTPGIHSLNKHDKGEYIFLTPGHALNLPPAPPLDVSKNPYRGLLPFEEEHNKLFFGRNELIEKLQNIVKTNPLTVVLGASGSGKSSLVKAGLIPKLRKEKTEKWYFLPPIRPGKTPLQALNNALKQIQLPEVDPQNPQHNLVMSIDVWAKKIPNFKFLLFIDQSEEIITLCQDEDERKEFFQQILQAINAHRDKLRVVLSLSSDFEPQVRDAGLQFIPTGYNVGNTVLKGRWLNGRFIVPAMTRKELREAIEKPAETRVMYFQPHDLVEQLIDEVADMPGALPLLSFGLSELYLKYLKRQWDAGNEGITIDRALTQADYQELGGVILSLTQRADEEYQALVQENPAYSHVIRHVMLRMVALGGGELARRQVPLSELEYPPAQNSLVKEVIEHFSTARLLVKGQDVEGNPYVEPAHDALVRGWQRLLMWKQEDEESLILQRRLTPAAQEWKSKQQAKYLWNANPRLDLLKKVLNSNDNWLNKAEAEFVQRSVGRKSFNTRRNWSIAIAVILGLGTGLVFSLIGQRNALIGQIRATRLSAEANLPNQELNALLDSLRAEKYLKDWPGYLSLFKPESKLPFLKPDTELQPQVLQTLRKVFYVAKERNRIEVPQDFNKMFFTPDGTLLIATARNDGIVRLQDLNGQKLSKVFSGHKGKVTLDVDRDGRLLATIDEQGTVRLWNSEGKQEEPPKLVASIPQSTYSHVYDRELRFSHDGKQLVAYVNGGTKTGNARTIYLWNLSESEPKLLKKSQDNFSSISFNSNNQLVVATQSNDTLGLSDFMSGKKLAEFKDFYGTLFGNLVFSPDGQHLAAYYGADMRSAYFGSLDDKSWKDFEPITRSSSISFDASSHLIIGQDGDGIIDVYDPYSIKYSFSKGLQFELKGHQGSIREVISSSNGRQFASLGNDHTIRLWEIENKPVAELSKIPNLISISISPDGKQLAVLESDGTVRLLDLNANELKRFVDFQGKISQIIFSPDGQQLAAVGKDSTIRLLDMNGKELYKSRNFEKTISQLIFSPDGKQLAVVENDGTIHLFNLNNETWEILPDKVSPNDKLGETRRIIGFSSDGRLLVANSLPTDFFPQEQGNIFLSELGAGIGKELVKFKGAGKTFNSIGLNTQGNLLASANMGVGSDAISDIHVWDMSGKLLTTFKAQHQGEVTNISLSADGNLMATLGKDGTAKLWRIGGIDELLEQSCDRLRDYLQNNPKVSESDRHLCDDVPKVVAKDKSF